MRGIAFGLVLAVLLGLTSHKGAAAEPYKLLRLDGHYVKWGDTAFGEPATVRYAVAQGDLSSPDARNCKALRPMDGLLNASRIAPAAFRAELRAALDSWERVANIRFREADSAAAADIVIGAQGAPRGRAFTNVDYADAAGDGVRVIDKALICLNPETGWKVGFDGDEEVYDLRYTLIHEIGHAIGLDHSGPEGTVMAFRYGEVFRAPQPGDAAGAGILYGAAGAVALAAPGASGEGSAAGSPPPRLSLGDEAEPAARGPRKR